jgi:hypothetical protein
VTLPRTVDALAVRFHQASTAGQMASLEPTLEAFIRRRQKKSQARKGHRSDEAESMALNRMIAAIAAAKRLHPSANTDDIRKTLAGTLPEIRLGGDTITPAAWS